MKKTYVISKTIFKAKALEYFRNIQKNKIECIITDHGEPVLKIVPYSSNPKGELDSLKNSVLEYNNPLEPVALEDWELLNVNS